MAKDHIVKRGNFWHYVRRVPVRYRATDPRTTIRRSLRTDDRAVAIGLARDMDRVLETEWAANHAALDTPAKDASPSPQFDIEYAEGQWAVRARERCDRLTRLAKRLFGVPDAYVSFVDRDVVRSLTSDAVEPLEFDRIGSFCGYAVTQTDVLYVPDTRSDERFKNNPLVTGPAGIRFYASMPFYTPDNRRRGNFCIMDVRPRTLDEADFAALRDLAACIEDELDLVVRSEARSAVIAERLKAVLDTSNDAILSVDATGRIELANVAAEDIFGRSIESLIGTPFAALVDVDFDAEAGPETVERFFDDLRAVRRFADFWVRRPSNATVPVRLAAAQLVEDQQPHFIVTVRDVSEQRATEAKLVESETRYAEATRQARLAHWEWDEIEERFIYLSPLFAELHHRTLEDCYSRQGMTAELMDLVHPDDVQSVIDIYKSHIRTKEPYEFTYRTLLPNGDIRYLRETAQNYFNADGRIVRSRGTTQDITDIRETEIALRASEDRLRSTLQNLIDANEAKSRFMANMSHELRTPLNSVIGYADILTREILGPLGDPRYMEYANSIRDSGMFLLDLVNDILDIERIEAGGYDIAIGQRDLPDLIADCVEFCAVRAETKGVNLSADLNGVPATVDADDRAFKQILINLVTNAVKFTNSGGSIIVRASVDSAGTAIVVEDTGIGIPKHLIADMLQPFGRLTGDPHLSNDGFGLGLAICRSLMELHGGSIELESELGVGTTVTVRFPDHGEAPDLSSRPIAQPARPADRAEPA